MMEKAQNRGSPRRGRGEGSVFQRCERQYGCPPRVPVLDEHGQPVLTPSGKPEMVRPEHTCRGMWIGQVQIGWVGTRREYGRVYARTKREALKKLDALKQDIARTGGQLPEKQLTVAKWFEYWLDNVCKVGPKTKPTYRGNIRKWIIPYLGRHRLESLRADHVRDLYTLMAEEGAQGARPQTHAILRKGLNDAMKERGLARNVATIAGTPAGKGSKKSALPAGEARKILSHVADDRIGSRWQFALLEGARRGECAGLEWDRVNLDEGWAELSWQLQNYEWRHGCGDTPCGRKKGGTCPNRFVELPENFEHRHLEDSFYLVRPKSRSGYRTIPLVPTVVAALRKRLEAYESERAGFRVDYGLVWTKQDGTPFTSEEDLDAWKQVCERSGAPTVDQHTARRTTATLLLEGGVDIKIVEAILGHADAETSRRYQYVDLRLAREALTKVEKLLTAVEPKQIPAQ